MDSSCTSTLYWSPEQARLAFRTDPTMQKFRTSNDFCKGYMQTNITIVPCEAADDLAEFCRLNSVSCPLLYRSKPGEVSAGPLATTSDIRTDLNRYVIRKKTEDGRLEVSTAWQLVDYSWDNMVTFYTGCSVSFVHTLVEGGVPLQNIARGVDCSMFRSNIECMSAGRISCPEMVVSMRPISKHLLQKTVTITAKLEGIHGAPIHIGDPAMIGIKDILNPEWGHPDIFDDDQLVPVFWACGDTSKEALDNPNLDVSFGHSVPGTLFVTDILTEDYFKDHPPDHGDEQPVVITVNDNPYHASILGQTTLDNIRQIESIIQEELASNGREACQMSGGLVKTALRISHARSVAVVTGVGSEDFVAAVVMVTTLQTLGKKGVTVLASDVDTINIIEECVKCGVLTEEITIELSKSTEEQRQNKFDVVIHVGKGDDLQVNETGSSTSDRCNVIHMDVPLHGSVAVAMAVFLLQNCLIHSRYRRYGVGLHQPVDMAIVSGIVDKADQVLELLSSHGVIEKTDSAQAKAKYKHILDKIRGKIPN